MPTPPFRSKLVPYQKEVFRMWYNERATLKQIQAWLETKDVIITLSSISSFIRSRKRTPDPHDPPPSFKRKQRKSKNGVEKALARLEELMKSKS